MSERVQFIGSCPNCGGTLFKEGPRGGLSVNVRCVKCGTTYWTAMPFGFGQPPMMGWGRTEQSADLFHGEPTTLDKIFKRGMH